MMSGKQSSITKPSHGGDSFEDPSKKLPGFDKAKRKTWVFCNRLRSRTAMNLERWGLQESALCTLQGSSQSMSVMSGSSPGLRDINGRCSHTTISTRSLKDAIIINTYHYGFII